MSLPKSQHSMRCPICPHAQADFQHCFQRPDLGTGVQYQLYRCQECGFGFIDGPLDEAILEQVYGRAFHTSSQQNAAVNARGELTPESYKAPIIINAQYRVQQLKKWGLEGRLLDVGAGKGFFVKLASSHFDAEGIELSASAVNTALDMGLKVCHGNFLEADLPLQAYDLITLWDVLASLPEPQVALAKIGTHLKRKGSLVLTLPDYSSPVAKATGPFWPLMIPPINLGYYTPKAVEALLAQAGFKLISIERVAKWVSVAFLVQKLIKTLGKSPASFPIPVPGQWKIPLNLGDIMTVRAIKRA